MACGKCGQNNCNCNSGGSGSSQQQAQLDAQVQELQDTVAQISAAVAPLINGHPILLVEHPDDVALFDLGSGLGSGFWAGWGICNGSAYPSSTLNKNIATPDLRDKVPVGAGGSYNVDDQFGADSINLTVGQLPAHNHAVTDPGHDHAITDPGHHHAITDNGHTHGASSAPHGHTLTINNNGAHNHQYAGEVDAISNGGSGAFGWDGSTLSNTTVDGSHNHTGNADNTSVAVTVASAATGIHVDDDITGITINSNTTGVTTQNTGNDDKVDVRQKSYAVFFAMRIG